MDGYGLAMFVHILGTVLLFSGLVLTTAALVAMARAGTVAGVRRWTRIAGRADKLLTAGAGLLLLSRIYLILTEWGWRVAWINASLGALLLVSPLVPLGISMRLPRIAAPAPAVLRARTRDRILWLSMTALTCVSFGVLYLMLAKPS